MLLVTLFLIYIIAGLIIAILSHSVSYFPVNVLELICWTLFWLPIYIVLGLAYLIFKLKK